MILTPDLVVQDLRFALRSLWRSKGLSITIILTLALGIGANAAIFSLVRGVLLRPLVNRGEDRLIYIRQSAPGFGDENSDFSVPEIQDLKASVKSVGSFGEFSVIGFSMIGLGEPREVRAGVVSGSYFEVMGLRPVLGRLLDPHDDGPSAAPACVLTYRFWKDSLKGDPTVIGKTVRLDTRTATIVGVLEPSVQYPSQTEIIVNVVTSPHHLSATMVTGRVHRMTELFGRLAPGATLDQARAELRTDYAAMQRAHPEAYPAGAHYQISAVMLRDQITSGAKTILWVLLAASGLIFIIACSNVANLILARSVRREGELAIRAALGATTGALRRTLLAESLLLCVAGAAIGVLSARPMVAVLARYASRFSVRALDLTIDMSVLWVGAALAIVSAVLLAFVPRLPSVESSGGIGLTSSSSVRITGSTNRRLRIFAITQIAASFLLLAGASVLIKTLISLQETQTGFDMHQVLAVNVPVMSYGKTTDDIIQFYRQVIERISALPGVDRVALGTTVPWRDAGNFGPGMQFSGEGHVGNHEDDPLAQLRVVSPGFFSALGVPLIAGRDFNANDRRGSEPVVIISQSAAQRMFPGQDPINRHVMWTDPVIKFVYISPEPRRIVGVAADVDDEHVEPGPELTIYHPFGQIPDDTSKELPLFGGRLFIHTRSDPHALVIPVTQIIRGLSSEQPVEHAATLEDIRAEVLTPNRLNTLVFSGLAGLALLIAVVGVAGVLAFSVSGRTREFGIRLAVGAQPRHLLMSVVTQGAAIAVAGVGAGAILGYGLTRVAGSYFPALKLPSAWPVIASVVVLISAAVIASMFPAARAARVDVNEALRAE
ncbi:MAG TPA: ABC transporter permease [Bryocella sp.]|nr:ABC transporter permease [Bryocella sp.]